MNSEPDPLDALLHSISDGSPEDWTGVERSTRPGDRARLDALREVSRIADFHRGLQRTEDPAAPPEQWGDLVLLERLGAGARGEVHRAWDPGLHREVALKRMHPDADDAALLTEGRALARVRHANVVTVFGVDRREGRVGLWMELLPGWTLEQEVRARGALAPADVARLGLELCGALAAVHAAGLLHRDLKPANVIREPAGRTVLTDFGLGLRRDRPANSATPSGTPMYMAPEVLAGAPATERSDVYALGLTLWFALTGTHPFEVTSLADLESAAIRGPLPSLRERRSGLPGPLVAAIERAIAPDPSRRLPTANALAEALESAARRPATRRNALLIGAAVAVAVAAVAFVATRVARTPVTVPIPPAPTAAAAYDIEATFLRTEDAAHARLTSGDRIRPGDRLSLEVRATRPVWVYVLDEDEQGERYLLFPQPRFDTANPISADSTFLLPGTLDGESSAWHVTSAGGREYLLVVASPSPVPEIEAELGRLPVAEPGREVRYAPVGPAAMDRLRGIGGIVDDPAPAPAKPAPRSFERFRSLAGRERGVEGVWVRQVVLENPGR